MQEACKNCKYWDGKCNNEKRYYANHKFPFCMQPNPMDYCNLFESKEKLNGKRRAQSNVMRR